MKSLESVSTTFGITAAEQLKFLEEQRLAFLIHNGWDSDVLNRFGIVLASNHPVGSEVPLWHPKYQDQLHGCNYVVYRFHDVNGNPLTWYAFKAGTEIAVIRARLLGYDGGQKYAQYHATKPYWFLPQDRLAPKDFWLALAGDTKKTLFFCEGEADAITGHLHGISFVGLTGLDCFAYDNGQVLAAPGHQFNLNKRDCVLCPDQDPESTEEQPFKVATNGGGVAGGAQRWAEHVYLRGGTPYYYVIARTRVGKLYRGQKVGIAEYFKYGGAVEELLATLTKADVDENYVIQLLRDYAMDPAGNVQRLSPRAQSGFDTPVNFSYKAFTLIFAPLQIETRSQKNEIVFIPATKIWTKHPRRKTIKGYGFRPDEEPGLLSNGMFNLWNGFATKPIDWTTSEAGREAIAAFEDWGQTMFGTKWPWVRGLLAHMIQKPFVLRQHILVIQSPIKGIGKSQFFHLIRTIIGDAHACDIEPEAFYKDFNVINAAKLFVFFDDREIYNKSMVSRVKRQVTSPHMLLESKFKDSYFIPWFGVFVMATNKPVAIPLDDGERRVLQCTPRIAEGDKAAWQPRVQGYIRMLQSAEGRGYVMSYLMGEEWLADYDPIQDVPRSESFDEAHQASMSEKDYQAKLFFDFLPEHFAFDTLMTEGDDQVTKYMLDQAKNMTTTKCQIHIRPRAPMGRYWLHIYSKPAATPLSTWEDKQGHALLDGTTASKLALVRQILDETRKAISNYKDRRFTSMTFDVD